MVSIRCKMIVRQELEKLGLEHGMIDLGEVEIRQAFGAEEYENLRLGLLRFGLELMDNKKAILIEKIKTTIVEMIHYADDFSILKNSDYLSEKLNLNYNYIASLFSEAAGITLEKYIISHKIEKAKELILYDELNLTEISYKLGYKSVSHLSSQFKRITGLTPSFFKHLKHKRRIALESL